MERAEWLKQMRAMTERLSCLTGILGQIGAQ
jgi:hypothetical protein